MTNRLQTLREKSLRQKLLAGACKLWLPGLLAMGAISAGPVAAQQSPTPIAAAKPVIEPKVTDILKRSCDALAASKTLSFTAINTYEKAAKNGQPLFYSTRNDVTIQRPNKLHVVTPGDGVADEFTYDGKRMMAYVPSVNLVAVADAPSTIDQMLDTAWEKAAIYFPFSDVITSNPCQVFSKNITSSFYVGQSKIIGGTTTDIIALAGPDVQAELWIGAADHLLRMIRVVYPNEPAHALYQTDYSNWHLNQPVAPGAFAAANAAKATRITFEPPGPRLPPGPAKPAKQP